jgi:hypothetical protein
VEKGEGEEGGERRELYRREGKEAGKERGSDQEGKKKVFLL